MKYLITLCLIFIYSALTAQEIIVEDSIKSETDVHVSKAIKLVNKTQATGETIIIKGNYFEDVGSGSATNVEGMYIAGFNKVIIADLKYLFHTV